MAKSNPIDPTNSAFLNGYCPEFALALSKITGWEMVALLQPNEDSFIRDMEMADRGVFNTKKTGTGITESEYQAIVDLRTVAGRLIDFSKVDDGLFYKAAFGMYHVYCVTPGGEAVDIEGVRSEESLIAKWIKKDPRQLKYSARQILEPKDDMYVQGHDVHGDDQANYMKLAKAVIKANPSFFGIKK